MGDMSIAEIKQQLLLEVGSTAFSLYLQLLREWFGQRLTKDMLDFEVSSLLSDRGVELHTLLLHSLLFQCATGKVAGGSSGLASSSNLQAQHFVPSQTISSADGTAYTITSQIDGNNGGYIIPPIPGEEPFLYPPNAKDYPVQQEVMGAVELMEQDPPPNCDWLQDVLLTHPANENNVGNVELQNRFPPWFAHEYQRVNTKSYTHEINVIPNVTHVLPMIKDIVERKPHFKQHFVIPWNKKAPYLSSGASLYGRILVQAWCHNLQNVNQQITEYAVNAVKEHLKSIIVSIVKQRRPFRMRDKRILHSIGVPYPNPYLRQGFHMYDDPYGPDTTKMADVVMQVPTPFPTIEERERLAALQVAASYPGRDSRFISAKGTMMDFLLAIQNEPTLIPNNKSRVKLLDTILKKCNGFSGSQNVQYSSDYYDNDSDNFTQSSYSQMLPLASY